MVSDSNLIEVFHANTEVEALLYQTMLEEAGINVIERRSGDAISTSVIYPVPHLGIDLLVTAEAAPEALRLIEEFKQRAETGELAVPEGMAGTVEVPKTNERGRTSPLTIHDLIIRGGLVIAALIVLAIIIIYAFYIPH